MTPMLMPQRFTADPVSAFVDDRWTWLSTDGGEVATCRVGRTMITVGRTCALPGRGPQAAANFSTRCADLGLRPLIFHAPEPVPGMLSYRVAREAVLDVEGFTLKGPAMANVRHSVARARRGGLEVSHRTMGACGPALRAELQRLGRLWGQGRVDLRFTYGSVIDQPESAMVSLVSSPRGVEAYASWRTVPGGTGLVMDLFRRRPDAEPGAVELMIADTLEWSRAAGVQWVSLGAVQEMEGSPAWLRAAGWVANTVAGSGLARFKDKFRPDWQDRYLVVSRRRDVPSAMLALAWVHVRGARPRRIPARAPRQAPRIVGSTLALLLMFAVLIGSNGRASALPLAMSAALYVTEQIGDGPLGRGLALDPPPATAAPLATAADRSAEAPPSSAGRAIALATVAPLGSTNPVSARGEERPPGPSPSNPTTDRPAPSGASTPRHTPPQEPTSRRRQPGMSCAPAHSQPPVKAGPSPRPTATPRPHPSATPATTHPPTCGGRTGP